jgi:hypothetical protein
MSLVYTLGKKKLLADFRLVISAASTANKRVALKLELYMLAAY